MVNSIRDHRLYKPMDYESRLHGPIKKEADSTSNCASKVNLSDTQQKMTALKEMINNTPDVNSRRVELIKSEIQAGNYQINGQQIARKMLADLKIA